MELTDSIFWIIMGILMLTGCISSKFEMVILGIFILMDLIVVFLPKKMTTKWTVDKRAYEYYFCFVSCCMGI